MQKIRQTSILFILLLFNALLFAQQEKPAFWNDIQAFKKKDSVSFPPKNAILFVGSSSFTRWTDVQQYFPSHTIINRGFGGSTLVDVIRLRMISFFPINLNRSSSIVVKTILPHPILLQRR